MSLPDVDLRETTPLLVLGVQPNLARTPYATWTASRETAGRPASVLGQRLLERAFEVRDLDVAPVDLVWTFDRPRRLDRVSLWGLQVQGLDPYALRWSVETTTAVPSAATAWTMRAPDLGLVVRAAPGSLPWDHPRFWFRGPARGSLLERSDLLRWHTLSPRLFAAGAVRAVRGVRVRIWSRDAGDVGAWLRLRKPWIGLGWSGSVHGYSFGASTEPTGPAMQWSRARSPRSNGGPIGRRWGCTLPLSTDHQVLGEMRRRLFEEPSDERVLVVPDATNAAYFHDEAMVAVMTARDRMAGLWSPQTLRRELSISFDEALG